ncbi:MAG: DUF1573 domain-containing protein [Bacteroidia bacterium]|nr:DUF1573 domain-containing protein [Bacteroidia bacterium]NNJ55994.1 DUF1573 domain-containing protein [Bacteroidia bacterium]
MKYSIVCILVLGFQLCLGQEPEVEVNSILEKLEKLEKLKESNDSISSIDLISNSSILILADSSKGTEAKPEESIITVLTIADTSKILQPIISFDTTTFNVGSITQGEVVKKKFTFKNIGTEDLEIINVIPDCSCTSPEWSTEIVRPNMNGYIIATYDSHDDIGKFLKTITVLHNAGEGFTFLEISGFVSPKL